MSTSGQTRRVLVLGGTGFIGSTVASVLARRGDEVTVVGRNIPDDLPCDGLRLDLTSPGAMGPWVLEHDAVVCLAGYAAGTGRWRVTGDDPSARAVNVGVVADLLETVRASGEAPTVVLASSVAAGVSPLIGYAAHKAEAEQLVHDATVDGAGRGVSVRLPTVYGVGTARPVRDHGVVATFVRRAIAGQPLTLWDGGHARRSLVHVDDAAAAIVAALDGPESLGPVPLPVGPAESTRVRDLADMVARAVQQHLGAVVDVVRAPAPPQAAPTDLQDVVVDASPFSLRTGWTPEVSLREGIEGLVEALAAESVAPHRDHPPDVRASS